MKLLPKSGQIGPLTKGGIGVLLGGAACYVAGWRLGWIELMVVAGGCLVALVIAIPFVIGRLGLELHRSIEPQRAMVGEPANAVMRARNPHNRRIRGVFVEETIGDKTVPVSVPSLPAGGEHTTLYALPTGRRAKVTIGPAVVSRSDPLALMRREVSQAASTTLWVHPRWGLVQPLPSGYAKDLEGPTSDTSPAGDIAFHALRQYRMGDDRRHIHWMSSARTGQLMVRHYVDNRRPALGVLLDTDTMVYNDTQFELAVEVTASLLMSSMAYQLPVTGRTGTEWLMGRLRPASTDILLERLTVVGRDEEPALLSAASDLMLVEPTTSAVAIVTGTRTAAELLAPVAYLRRRARVIVIAVNPDAKYEITTSPRGGGVPTDAEVQAAVAGAAPENQDGAPSSDTAAQPDHRLSAVPGARVINVDSLVSFRHAWNRLS